MRRPPRRAGSAGRRPAAVASALTASARFNSRFLQAIHLAIKRGSRPAGLRGYCQLPVAHAEVPMMNARPLALLTAVRPATGETERAAPPAPPTP